MRNTHTRTGSLLRATRLCALLLCATWSAAQAQESRGRSGGPAEPSHSVSHPGGGGPGPGGGAPKPGGGPGPGAGGGAHGYPGMTVPTRPATPASVPVRGEGGHGATSGTVTRQTGTPAGGHAAGAGAPVRTVGNGGGRPVSPAGGHAAGAGAPVRTVGNGGGRPASPAGGHAVGPTAGPGARSEVRLDSHSALQPRADRSGYTAVRTQPNGSRVVMNERALPDGGRRVSAYEERRVGGGTTRLYTDGRLVTRGPDYRSVGRIGGPQFVRYDNGLHAAFGANGHPLYTERFRSLRGADGSVVRGVERRSFVTVIGPGGLRAETSLVRFYPLIGVVGGVALYAYQPIVYPSPYYFQLYQPLPAALVVGEGCPMCPLPTVAYEEPVPAYTDPMDLIGDRVISDGSATGPVADQGAEVPAIAVGEAPPAEEAVSGAATDAPSAPPPEVGAAQTAFGPAPAAEISNLKSTATELRREAAANPAAAAGSGAQASDPRLTTVSFEGGNAGSDAAPTAIPLAVSEYVHGQLRKEVRYGVALQQNRHLLLVPEIIGSDYAKAFVFQAAAPIDVDVGQGGDQCTLGEGDLLRFARLPAPTDAVVSMRVVTSHPGHCRANETVELGVNDLQDMLNSFAERVEREKAQVNACLATGGTCMRT